MNYALLEILELTAVIENSRDPDRIILSAGRLLKLYFNELMKLRDRDFFFLDVMGAKKLYYELYNLDVSETQDALIKHYNQQEVVDYILYFLQQK